MITGWMMTRWMMGWMMTGWMMTGWMMMGWMMTGWMMTGWMMMGWMMMGWMDGWMLSKSVGWIFRVLDGVLDAFYGVGWGVGCFFRVLDIFSGCEVWVWGVGCGV